MYIKTFNYEQIAFVVVKNYLKKREISINAGRKPSSFDVYYEITCSLPEKYNDENTTPNSYWTKHNEKKLRKYIKNEITRRQI